MHLRTFHAASIQEAIRQARQELGADAMLLNSRRMQSAEAQDAATVGSRERGKSAGNTAAAEGGLFAVTFATASPPAQKASGAPPVPTNAKGTGRSEASRATEGCDFDSVATRYGAGQESAGEARSAGRRALSQREVPLGYDAVGKEKAPRDGEKVSAVDDRETQADSVTSGSSTSQQTISRDMGGTLEGDRPGAGVEGPRTSRGNARRANASDQEDGERALPSYDKLFEQMTSMRREMLQLAGTVRRAGADSYRQELPAEQLRWAYDALVSQEFYLDLIEDVIEELSPRYAAGTATTATTAARQTDGRQSSAKSRGRKRGSRKAELHPARDILPALREALAQRIELDAEPGLRRRSGKPQLVVLVGPPGVGKTTTLVKLAARYGMSSRFPLQIVSMDNYRVGASEQLRTYASILGVGFDALPSAAALQKALASYQAKELILIDTPGYGWRDFPAASDLAALLREETQTTIYLTVSASMKPSDLARVADLYEVFDYDSLLFTKIDETATIGPMVSESVLRRKPLSYFCAGQRIPDDIEVASRERLLERMLPEIGASDECAA